MDNLYMGIDCGSIIFKGIIMDSDNKIITSSYAYVLDDPIKTIKMIIREMKREIDFNKYKIVSIGVTGVMRKLIGTFLDANIIKNEISASIKGVLMRYPFGKSVLEIGGENAKIINLKNGKISEYDMYKLGIGRIIDSYKDKYKIDINEIDTSKRLEFDTDELLEIGCKKEDIMNSLCTRMIDNYIDKIKDYKIVDPILIGGVSKNKIIVNYLEERLNTKIKVIDNDLFISAIGIALMGKESGFNGEYNLEIEDDVMDTKIMKCDKCNNKCSLLMIYKNNILKDYWGNKCEKELY